MRSHALSRIRWRRLSPSWLASAAMYPRRLSISSSLARIRPPWAMAWALASTRSLSRSSVGFCLSAVSSSCDNTSSSCGSLPAASPSPPGALRYQRQPCPAQADVPRTWPTVGPAPTADGSVHPDPHRRNRSGGDNGTKVLGKPSCGPFNREALLVQKVGDVGDQEVRHSPKPRDKLSRAAANR